MLALNSGTFACQTLERMLPRRKKMIIERFVYSNESVGGREEGGKRICEK